MPRLIDADELFKTIARQEMWNVPDFVYESIKNAPTVEAEPVVKCKECIHYWNNAKNDKATFVTVCLASPKDDAYCSEGERRKDE